MTIAYVTAGAWGAGTGSPLPAATVDGNFYTVALDIAALQAAVAVGKRISSVSYTASSFTFTFTDATTQVIPLPVADLTLVGEWTPLTPYTRAQMVTVRGLGTFRILEDHTSAATFDPNATDGSTDDAPLYQLWLPSGDINYDVAPFVPGSIARDLGDLFFQFKAPRSMTLPAGDDGAYAYLETALDGGDADTILSLQKNGTQVGTITFTGAGGDTDGGQEGTISIAADVSLIAGDLFAIRVTQSTTAVGADLSITLPFVRTDI